MSQYFSQQVPICMGTFPLKGNELATAIKHAFEAGYRGFDTAQMYENEAALGSALTEIGCARESLFITTKVLPAHLGKDKFMVSVEESLRALKTDYVDVLLLHWPTPSGENREALELLQQAEREKRIWNLVLGSIAGISLLVGGIGIMNIMLATVTERTREIGIRRALGAKRRDIISQFLVETMVLSTFGGLLGIVVGVAIPTVVSMTSQIETTISLFAISVAFGISVMVGIVFGVYPARRAAILDPIEALRHQS